MQMQSNKQRVRTLQGLFIGAGLPLVLGSLMLVRFQLSLPDLQPGEAHCGTGALGPFCIILCWHSRWRAHWSAYWINITVLVVGNLHQFVTDGYNMSQNYGLQTKPAIRRWDFR